jgi:hypothetical protein
MGIEISFWVKSALPNGSKRRTRQGLLNRGGPVGTTGYALRATIETSNGGFMRTADIGLGGRGSGSRIGLSGRIA